MPKQKKAHSNGKPPELKPHRGPQKIAEELKERGYPEEEAEELARLSYERRKPNGDDS